MEGNGSEPKKRVIGISDTELVGAVSTEPLRCISFVVFFSFLIRLNAKLHGGVYSETARPVWAGVSGGEGAVT